MDQSQSKHPGSAGYEVGRFVADNLRAFTIGAIGLALASLASAQPSEAILQGCNALADADRRMECLKAALQLSKPSTVPTDGITRAFVGLQGALDSGISYRAYQGLIVDVARELAIYKRSAPPEFAAAVSKLEMAP